MGPRAAQSGCDESALAVAGAPEARNELGLTQNVKRDGLALQLLWSIWRWLQLQSIIARALFFVNPLACGISISIAVFIGTYFLSIFGLRRKHSHAQRAFGRPCKKCLTSYL